MLQASEKYSTRSKSNNPTNIGCYKKVFKQFGSIWRYSGNSMSCKIRCIKNTKFLHIQNLHFSSTTQCTLAHKMSGQRKILVKQKQPFNLVTDERVSISELIVCLVNLSIKPLGCRFGNWPREVDLCWHFLCLNLV